MMLDLHEGKPSPGTCASTAECAPGEVCDPAWKQCLGACVAGERRCDKLRPRVCGANGEWTALGLECSNGCRNGYCEEAKSCRLEPRCGDGEASCCEVKAIEGGTFQLPNDPRSDGVGSVERSVSPFALDRFEVTIGRFRRFILAYDDVGRPRPGDGAHPNIPGSGWQDAWTRQRGLLPDASSGLNTLLTSCGQTTDGSIPEDTAVGCVNWYMAAAFCIWDGGRLPTEAEWTFAAMGGDEQRIYPWSMNDHDVHIDAERAFYHDDESSPAAVGPAAVGGRARSSGRFGNEDMAGNVWEWVADAHHAALRKGPCHSDVPAALAQRDCEELDVSGQRVQKGGSYLNAGDMLKNHVRGEEAPERRKPQYGFRCARDLDQTARP